MPLKIRIATAADASRLAALVNSAYRGDSSRAGWTTEADLLGGQRTDDAALEEFIQSGKERNDRAMLLHEQHGEPIACVQLEQRGTDAYLGMLTILPTKQASGLGKALLSAAEDFVVRRWRVRRMIMSVISVRTELIAWYERRGYACTGETAAFPYGDLRFGEPKLPDLQFVILSKALSQTQTA